MRISTNSHRALGAAALAALATLLGCTVGPHYHAPAPPTVTSYTAQPQPTETAGSSGPAGIVQRLEPSFDVPEQWWTLFQCPPLNRMVQQALRNSPTLAQATAKLEEAQQELSARTGATKFPTVTGSASVAGEQPNLAAFGIPFPNPSPFALLNGSIAVSYALDIFGANRRLIESLRAQSSYEAWQLEGARLMLEGNVVLTAIRQAELQQELDTTRQLIDVQAHELTITEQRYRAGGASRYDVRSQQTALAQIKAALPALEQQRDAANDELALLVGKSPGETPIARVSLAELHLPEQLPLSLPSELVRQRPDIRAAEALLHQASANVGIATANLYPQLTLTGSGGGIGTSFTSGGDLWNIGTSLTQPIFDGGELHAEKLKAEASYEEADSVYRQTVLQAFREVADSLSAIQHDAYALQARAEATNSAEEAYRIASQRYEAGGISELALLDAQRQRLQTALDRTSAIASRYTDSATLIQSLGGGWWNGRHAQGRAGGARSREHHDGR